MFILLRCFHSAMAWGVGGYGLGTNIMNQHSRLVT